MENPSPISPEYIEPGASAQASEPVSTPVPRVEGVFGMFPSDTTVPTAPARKLDEQIRIVDGNVHIYDTANDTWIELAPLRQLIFAGEVAANGSAVSLPPGWTSAKSATGTYVVTHNLGSAAYNVVATPFFSGDSRMTAIVLTRGANSFSINTLLTVSLDTDNPFFFILMRQ